MIQLKSANITNPTKENYNKQVTASAAISFQCDTEEEQELVRLELEKLWSVIARDMSKALLPAGD